MGSAPSKSKIVEADEAAKEAIEAWRICENAIGEAEAGTGSAISKLEGVIAQFDPQATTIGVKNWFSRQLAKVKRGWHGSELTKKQKADLTNVKKRVTSMINQLDSARKMCKEEQKDIVSYLKSFNNYVEALNRIIGVPTEPIDSVTEDLTDSTQSASPEG